MMKKKKLFTRRDAIITGLTTVGGLLATGCASRPTPPSYGSLLRMGDNLTYIAHRFLLPGQALVKEYNFRDISSFPATGTTNPADTSKLSPSEDLTSVGLFTFGKENPVNFFARADIACKIWLNVTLKISITDKNKTAIKTKTAP